MLVTVSVTMVILTTPNTIFNVFRHYRDTNSSVTSAAAYHVFHNLSVILVTVNNAVNFYLYFISGQKFRQQCISPLAYGIPYAISYTILATFRTHSYTTTENKTTCWIIFTSS
jgi:hypothetical protein